MRKFWIDVLKISLGVTFGGFGALVMFISLLEVANKYAPWIFKIY